MSTVVHLGECGRREHGCSRVNNDALATPRNHTKSQQRLPSLEEAGDDAPLPADLLSSTAQSIFRAGCSYDTSTPPTFPLTS